MMTIRVCEVCGSRVRTTARSACRCPRCKATIPADSDPQNTLAPTAAERSVWYLGRVTETMGVVLPAALLAWHEHFSMSWLGAGLIAAALGAVLVVAGRWARLGTSDESIGQNLTALALFYVLTADGFLAFPPLDAMGGSAMVALAACGVVMCGEAEIRRFEKLRSWSWFILLGFLAAYAYHAAGPFLGRR